jgi:hypothetical protein
MKSIRAKNKSNDDNGNSSGGDRGSKIGDQTQCK